MGETVLVITGVVMTLVAGGVFIFLIRALGQDAREMPLPIEGWTFAVLPDTQIYAQKYPEHFEAQCRFLAEQKDALKLRFVVHIGDLTNDNSEAQWDIAERAMKRLDGVVPYVVMPGNHDYSDKGHCNDRKTSLHARFPLEHRRAHGGLVEAYEGDEEPGRVDNTLSIFETPDGPWMVLGLEFAPRDEVLAWARGLLEAHREIPCVLGTHAHLYSDGSRYDKGAGRAQDWSPYAFKGLVKGGGVNDAQEVYEKLIEGNDHVRFVVSGHVLHEGVAQRSSRHASGAYLHELLANYQHRAEGGEGFLRLIEIREDRCRVYTYSPSKGRFKTDPANDFELPL